MSANRITKDLSEKLARDMLVKKEDKLTELNSSLRTFLKTSIRNNIPEEVIKLYKKYPDYFSSRSHFEVSNVNGYHMGWFNLDQEFPAKGFEFKLDEASSEKFTEINSVIEKKEAEYREVFEQTKEVIYSLRTYKKIIEAFPECKDILSSESEANTQLLDINVLRRKING